MKKNGFTLVELLAALVLLSILTTVAVGSVLRVVDKNRREIYVEDAKKFISQVDYQVRAGKIKYPTNGNCIVVSLDYTNSSDFKKGPNGGRYYANYSFVLLKNEASNDKFYVRLVENVKGTGKGISMAELSSLQKNKGKEKVETIRTDNLFVVNNDTVNKIRSLYSGCGSITVYSKEEK